MPTSYLEHTSLHMIEKKLENMIDQFQNIIESGFTTDKQIYTLELYKQTEQKVL